MGVCYRIYYNLNSKNNSNDRGRIVLYSKDTLEEIDNFTKEIINADEIKLLNQDKISNFLNSLKIKRNKSKLESIESIRLFEVISNTLMREDVIPENKFNDYYVRHIELTIEDNNEEIVDFYLDKGFYHVKVKYVYEELKEIPIMYKSNSRMLPFDKCIKVIDEKLRSKDPKIIRLLCDRYNSILTDDLKSYLNYLNKRNLLNSNKYDIFLNTFFKNISKMNNKQRYVLFRRCLNIFELYRSYIGEIKPKNLKVHLLNVPIKTEIKELNSLEELFYSGRFEELFNLYSLEEIDKYIDLEYKERRK